MPAKSPGSSRDLHVNLQWPRDRISDAERVSGPGTKRRAVEAGTDSVTVGSLQILLEEYAQDIVAAVEGAGSENASSTLAQVRRLSKAVEELAGGMAALSTEVAALRRRVALAGRTPDLTEPQLAAITKAVLAAVSPESDAEKPAGRRSRRSKADEQVED